MCLCVFQRGQSGGNSRENVGDFCHLLGSYGDLFAFVHPIVLRKEESYGKTEITFIFRPPSLHPKQYAEGFDCLHVFGFAGGSIRAVPDDRAFGGNLCMDNGILWAVCRFILVYVAGVSADTGRMALGIRWV